MQTYPDDTSLGIGSSSLQNEVRLSQDSLRVLSDETGGFAVVNRNDFATAYERIVDDNSSYYVLAYYPPSDEARRQVPQDRRPRARARVSPCASRKGYASPKGKAPAPPTTANAAATELRDALDSPLPVSGLTMHVFAAPFKGTAPNASVLLGVELRGRDLRLGPNDKVDALLSRDRRRGEGPRRQHRLDHDEPRPETKARVEQSGLRLLNRVDLPPGRYQLRVAAHDSAGGALGSVLYDLDVPDFAKAPFSHERPRADLAQRGGAADGAPRRAAQADPARAARRAMRTFPQNDELMLFAEVYDNEGSIAAQGRHHDDGHLRRREGGVQGRTERASSELQGAARRLRLHRARFR